MKVSETFWLTIISQFQHAFIYVGVILFFLIPKSGRKQYVELGSILIVSAIGESSGWVGVLLFHANMNLSSSLLTLIYFVLIISFYRKRFPWSNADILAYILIAAFIIFGIVNLLFIQGVTGPNSYPRAVASFVYIVISITYLFGYAFDFPREIRVKHPMFWISIAILGYNSVVLYISLWIDYLVNVKNNKLIEVLMVHNTVGAVYYVVLWHALILIRREHKTIVI